MEEVSKDRKKWIEELTEVIGRADSFLKDTYEYYQWDMKDLEKVAEEKYITCPFDKSHIVPERSMHKHLESCEWKTLGYTKDCKPLPESAIPVESPFSIKFDMELQFKVLQEARLKNPLLDVGKTFIISINDLAIIKFDPSYSTAVVFSRKLSVLFTTWNRTDEKLIPQTSDRLTSDFTRDERKAMYEYVVAHTLAPDVGQDITDLNKPEKKEERSTSLLELLAQERNLKRRKTRYRGVHTNKKSHNEIMREVVQQQMEMYKEYLAEKFGIAIPDENQENYFNNVKNESHSECSSSKHISQDRNRDSYRCRDPSQNYQENSKYYDNDSHRSHSKDYNDKSRESHKNYSRYYNKSSRHSIQYENRDYKSHSKDSSSRRDYRDDDDYNYKSRDRSEEENYSRKHSDKNKKDNTKEYRDRCKSSRDYNNSDKNYDIDNYRENRKRDRDSSVDKKCNSKFDDDSYSRKNKKKHDDVHKDKKHKSDKSNKEKKPKTSKHKRKSRSRSKS